jgi:hypothetical protein
MRSTGVSGASFAVSAVAGGVTSVITGYPCGQDRGNSTTVGRRMLAWPLVALAERRIAISVEAFEAFEAIARTLPLASVGFEREPHAHGERFIWLEPRFVESSAASYALRKPPNHSAYEVT